jgi:hypothetical protein
MDKTTEALKAAAALAPYIEKLGGYLDGKITHTITEARQKSAHNLFQDLTKEIYDNLAVISSLNMDEIKCLKINSPELKRIAVRLQNKHAQKSIRCAKEFPQLKAKDTKRILDRVSLASHKIDALRALTGASDKALKIRKQFRPAVRLHNIRAVYLEISRLLK